MNTPENLQFSLAYKHISYDVVQELINDARSSTAGCATKESGTRIFNTALSLVRPLRFSEIDDIPANFRVVYPESEQTSTAEQIYGITLVYTPVFPCLVASGNQLLPLNKERITITFSPGAEQINPKAKHSVIELLRHFKGKQVIELHASGPLFEREPEIG